MSEMTTEQIEAIRARRQAVKDAKGFTEMYDAISESYKDIDLLLADNERLRVRVAELESQNVQAAKVILDTRDLLEASEKYMGDNPEWWFKTHLRKIVEADSYRTQRYNLNVDLNAD